MQTLARPGEVMVSERTRALAAGAFDYEDRGLQSLKGIAAPTRVWRVLGRSQAQSRFEAATRGEVAPMVGRDQEIALLLDRWELARATEGQVGLLQGEAGIGKSRMLRALRERLGDRLELALQYQCSPYYTNSAFYPIGEHIERALKFDQNDSAADKLDKIERYLLHALPDTRNRLHASLLARMLSIPCDERYGPLALSPQRQKDDTITLLVDIVAKVAAERATVVLFEDVHWADPSTLEVLSALIDRTEKLPLLVLITYRPEFTPPWTSRAHVTQLALSRLSRAQGASIVLRVSGKGLPSELVSQIVDKTDGVPLFLEELTKAVLESNIVVDAGDRYAYSGRVEKLAIPNTLRDSLMARLDRLIPVKEVAQIGACLGRQFSYELLEAVSPMKGEQLDEALDKLLASELVFRRGTPPTATYIFKHALVQDAAYDSLLKSKRQTLHGQIAAVIEQRFPSKAETEPELLAHHYTEAAEISIAIPYWQRAGELAQHRVALQEAIGHFQRALQLTRSLPASAERDAREIHLRALLGIAWVELHGYTHPEVEATLAPAWRLNPLQEHDAVRILWGLWVCRLCSGEVRESLLWAERLLARAEERDSETMRIVGHWTACNSYFFLGEFTQCVDHANALLERYDQARDASIAHLVNHDPKTIALLYRAAAESILGYPDRAVASAEEGIVNASRLMHPFDRCWARFFGTMFVFAPLGYVARADTLIDEVESYAEEQRLLFFSSLMIPMARALGLAWSGDAATGFDACRRVMAQLLDAGHGLVVPYVTAAAAESAARCNRLEEVEAILDQALSRIEAPKGQERQALAELLRLKALRLAATGCADASEACFREALTVARQQSARFWELRAATSFALTLLHQGRRAEALHILEPVYAWFAEGHQSRDLLAATSLLAELRACTPSPRSMAAL
jgi:hypothetical protein